jgi:hypothetical protein
MLPPHVQSKNQQVLHCRNCIEKSQAGLVDAASVDLVKNFDQAGPSGSVAQAAGLLTSVNSLDIMSRQGEIPHLFLSTEVGAPKQPWSPYWLSWINSECCQSD